MSEASTREILMVYCREAKAGKRDYESRNKRSVCATDIELPEGEIVLKLTPIEHIQSHEHHRIPEAVSSFEWSC